MRPAHEYEAVQWLIDAGLNDCQVVRAMSIPLATVRKWRLRVQAGQGPPGRRWGRLCPQCHDRELDEKAYAYLLGLYLGDGHIVRMPNGVYRLAIFCAARYPRLLQECRMAVRSVRGGPMLPGLRLQTGCFDVYSYWKHWPCLFPQHGPGRKHERKIQLTPWQQEIVERDPARLLRGLIHSDGCRSLNRVSGYVYVRYQFNNRSDDIRAIFCRACDEYGIGWRQMNRYTISVARRSEVAKLDRIVGPKS